MINEQGRIEFLLQRDGIAATIEWVRRTLWIYRHALSGRGGYGHAGLVAGERRFMTTALVRGIGSSIS
jgi:hypothetical protein